MKNISWQEKPIFIASDHGGYALKKRLIRYLENELNLKPEDLGPYEYIETDDYPDFVLPLTKKVISNNGRGILICRSGIGVCITANKVKGIRAGIGYNINVSKSMRNDNDTNILCLAADNLSEDFAMVITKNWLTTDFSNHPRFIRRLKKIEEIEK
ncbi:MAG TPA: RpiB/LacA/LacB family sugar-phosphate isomerase [Candidatus Magasanikbacteria bacterium]|jgi:ribose 5-phosphate isomerase B|nr:RpiB/LacA/LacB family sugar-phosphate isomerase [Candidatus Magasanikbacteria bacterium]HQL53003.1 RpiB/LacA/LacB family sugar-phosphate isomerase [Candidatus Magasanikbacteria bacterium]